MTNITRVFNAERRSFTGVERQYSGQQYDSISTIIHFEYEPISFLSEGYVPYIIFAVYDDEGNPLTYGPDSSPIFDGYTFPIPWDVTSRVKTNRVEYQLLFVKNTVTFNGRINELQSTEYLLSERDGFALKSTITCQRKSPCCPPATAPTTEPEVIGWINYWKELGLISPVDQGIDEETGKLKLTFHTYNGTQDSDVLLDIPSLVDGKIPHQILDMITDLSETDSPESYQIPSALAVLDWLVDHYTPIEMSVSLWDATTVYSQDSTVVYEGALFVSLVDSNLDHTPTGDDDDEYWKLASSIDLSTIIDINWSSPTNDKVPSTLLTKNTFDTKLDKTAIVTSWGSPTSDDKVGSEKLVSDTLATKFDKSDVITEWNGTASDTEVPSEALVRTGLAGKVNNSQIKNNLTSISPSDIPSIPAVNTALGKKTDITQAVPPWDATETYIVDSVVLTSGSLYVSLRDNNTGYDPLSNTGTWWARVSGSGGGGENINVDFRVIQFGNTSDTEYILPHNMATENLIFSLRETDGTVESGDTDATKEFVQARIYAFGNSKVKVRMTNPPGNNALTLSIMALRAKASDAHVYPFDVLTPDDPWSIPNDTQQPIYVQTFDANGDEIAYTSISQPSATDFTPVEVTFGQNENGTAIIAETDLIETFINRSVWGPIEHGKNTLMAVQCYNLTGTLIHGSVSQGLNSVTVSWPTAQSGYAVLVPATDVVQMQSDTEWVLTHNLNRFVIVKVFDMYYSEIDSADITSISQDGNSVTITFATAHAGYLMIV